jgi:hypothetical protein
MIFILIRFKSSGNILRASRRFLVMIPKLSSR